MPLSHAPSIRSTRGFRTARTRAGVACAGGLLALIALTGCAPEAGTPASTPKASSTSKPSSEPTTKPTPTDSATPTPTPTPSATPVALECDQVLTPDDVYAFNPNFGSAPDYKPSGAAETAVSHDGVACGWLNQTSGEIIEVSIVQPNDVLMTRLKDAAIAQSKPVPTYGTPPAIDGFFTAADGPGEAQVFTPKYWVTLSSTAFFEPGDAQQLVATVVSHLP